MDNRVQPARALPIANHDLESMFEHVANPVVHVDETGQVLTANPSAADWLGTTPAAMVGQPLDRWIAAQTVEELVESAGDADDHSVAVGVRLRDGDREIRGAWTRVVCDGQAIRILLSSPSDPVRHQGEAALGALGPEVGHELNNHLLVLGGYAQLLPLHMEHGQWDKARADAEMILTEVDRAKHLVEGLVQAGPRSDALAICDISECVRSTVAFLQPLNRFDNIALRSEVHASRTFAGVARHVIHQWLLNRLCACADILADSEQATITVRTTPDPDWAARIIVERPDAPSPLPQPEPFRESATRLLVARNGLQWTSYPAEDGLRAKRADLCVPEPHPATARLVELSSRRNV